MTSRINVDTIAASSAAQVIVDDALTVNETLSVVGALSAGSIAITGDLPVSDGGTGASTAADARTNLGIGTMGTQSAASVAITGGSITGITDLAVADGGTGASTGPDALTNLGVTAFAQTLTDDADADAVIETIADAATAETSPAVGDLLLISDVSANDGRKMTLENTLKVINGLTEDTAPSTSADFVATYDASATAAKKVLLNNLSNGDYRTMRVYTANDTWSKPAGIKRVKVTVIGGGGGSGGCQTTGASQGTAAGGGGGGGTAIKVIEAGSLGATETVTVGTGGTAGAIGNNPGGTGNSSSFGAHCSATGGTGGGGGAVIGGGDRPVGEGKDGGIGSGGDLNIKGHAGGIGFVSISLNVSIGGMGGASHMGGGTIEDATGGSQAAQAGGAYGGGACGGALAASQTQLTGAAGADGVVIVEEFF